MVRGVASARRRFFSLRDEIWFRALDWFEEKTRRNADDPEPNRELTTPLYEPNSGRGSTTVESKHELKKRRSNSPDLADAFVLTFAGGLDQRRQNFADDWPESSDEKTT